MDGGGGLRRKRAAFSTLTEPVRHRHQRGVGQRGVPCEDVAVKGAAGEGPAAVGRHQRRGHIAWSHGGGKRKEISETFLWSFHSFVHTHRDLGERTPREAEVHNFDALGGEEDPAPPMPAHVLLCVQKLESDAAPTM